MASDGDSLLLAAAAAALAFLYFSQTQAAAAGSITVEPMDGGADWSPWSADSSWPTSSPATSSPAWSTFESPSMTTQTPAPPFLTPRDADSVSADGRAFIKAKEGLSLRAYGDTARFFSIGYGHQLQPGENYPNGITPAQADALFDSDVSRVEQTLNVAVTVPLAQEAYDALASLVYNIGKTAFLSSTLLRKLNARDYDGAAAEIPKWNLSDGRVNPVLVARRADELAVFDRGFA